MIRCSCICTGEHLNRSLGIHNIDPPCLFTFDNGVLAGIFFFLNLTSFNFHFLFSFFYQEPLNQKYLK